MKPASIFKRIMAFIIDAIILGTPIFFLVVKFWDSLPIELLNPVFIFLILLVIIYFALFESSKYQATPGKKLLNLYVSNLDNQKLNFEKALRRNLISVPPMFAFLFVIGFAIAAGNAIGYDKLIWIYIVDTCLFMAWYIPIFFNKRRMTTYDILSSSRVYTKLDASQLKKNVLINQISS